MFYKYYVIVVCFIKGGISLKKMLLFFLTILLIPYITITLLFNITEEKFKFIKNEYVRVLRSKTGEIEKIPLEEYVMGVIAGEMPVSFEIEALKAQAVASRSYVMYQMIKNQKKEYDVVDTVLNQVYLDSDTMKKKWGSKYDKYVAKIKQAVEETAYQYVLYDGEIAETLFFSTSVGYTENSEEIFVSKVPYLRSVKSEWDNISPVFDEDNSYSIEKFLKKLNLDSSDKLDIKILDTTSTGRINKIKINGNIFTGKEIANKLSLRSTYFTIEENNGQVAVTTRGYGHGVGMSQYGAQGMALEGYTYEEILKHYYTGIEIKKIKNV